MQEPLDEQDSPIGSTPRRKRRRLRIALICVGALIVLLLACAGGFYWWFTAKVHSANARIDPATEQALAAPPPSTLVSIPQSSSTGGPSSAAGNGGQAAASKKPPIDLIVLGSDPRPGVVNAPGSSDVIMLVHIDMDNDYLSVLSITRDLYVNIPGYGKNRINAAYTFGGPPLTIATIKQVFGVNATKFLQLGFKSFQDIVDSLGGVYVDVDRDYPRQLVSAAAINPGYQLLDGADALDFSRFRDDKYSDFGRMERQQRVLAALREQLGGWNLSLKLPGIVNSILNAATTNLSANDLIGLGKWVAGLDGSRIRRVVVNGSGEMIDGKAVIVADQQALKDAVTQLLTPPAVTQGPAPTQTGLTGDEVKVESNGPSFPVQVALRASTGVLPDAEKWQALQKKVPFRLQEPGVIPEGFTYSGTAPRNSGTYEIKPGDTGTKAVRVIYRRGDDYLGITATAWTQAPIASPGAQVEANGTVLTLVGAGDNVDQIWWKEGSVLYFVSNTVMSSLSTDEMLAVAKSMQPVEGAPAGQ